MLLRCWKRGTGSKVILNHPLKNNHEVANKTETRMLFLQIDLITLLRGLLRVMALVTSIFMMGPFFNEGW